MGKDFYYDYETMIINYVDAYIKNRTEAEDICHDTYCKFLDKFDSPEAVDIEYAKRWLLKTAKNEVLNFRKKASTRYETFDEEIDDYVYEKPHDDDRLKEIVYENLPKLNDLYYEVVVSKINDIPMENIMDKTGRSKHSLECIYTRAVKKLKKLIMEGEN